MGGRQEAERIKKQNTSSLYFHTPRDFLEVLPLKGFDLKGVGRGTELVRR